MPYIPIRIEISVIRTAGIITVVISLDREQAYTLVHIKVVQTLHVQREMTRIRASPITT
jgi:hypothetical protein